MIKFKVFKNEDDGISPPLFYFHVILGNNKIVAPSESYEKLASVHSTIAAIWFDAARAMEHPQAKRDMLAFSKRADMIKAFVQACPIPYTKDSLLQ